MGYLAADLFLSLILQGNRRFELFQVGDDNGAKCNQSLVLANAELMLVLGGTTHRVLEERDGNAKQHLSQCLG